MASLGTITQKRGDTGDITFTFKKDDIAYDLSGCTVRFTVRKKIPSTTIVSDTDSDVVIFKTTEIAGDDTSGVIFIEIDKSETNIDCKTYYYDIQIDKPSGKRYSSSVYKYIVSNDVVRS